MPQAQPQQAVQQMQQMAPPYGQNSPQAAPVQPWPGSDDPQYGG